MPLFFSAASAPVSGVVVPCPGRDCGRTELSFCSSGTCRRTSSVTCFTSSSRPTKLVACVGRDDAEVARRAAAIGREVDELKANGLAGTPAEVVDRIGQYAEAGSSRFYFQILDLHDLDQLELIADQIAPQLG